MSAVRVPTVYIGFRPSVPSLTGQWGLQHDLATGIRDRIESTRSCKECDDDTGVVALRVLHLRIQIFAIVIGEEIARA